MGIRAKFAHLWPLSWPNINIFQWEQLYLINSVQLYIHCNFKLGISKNVDFIAENPYFLQFFCIFLNLQFSKNIFKDYSSFIIKYHQLKTSGYVGNTILELFYLFIFRNILLDLATPILWHLDFPPKCCTFCLHLIYSWQLNSKTGFDSSNPINDICRLWHRDSENIQFTHVQKSSSWCKLSYKAICIQDPLQILHIFATSNC